MRKTNPDAPLQSAAASGPGNQSLSPCKFLRSKEMFYEQPGEESDDMYASGVFWCAKTQEAFGPDGEAAEKGECQCGRSCYAGL